MLLCGLVQAATALLVWRLLREHGAGRRLSLILLLAFLMFAAPTWGVRPQILASLLLAVLSLVLSRWRCSGSGATRRLWWLPLLALSIGMLIAAPPQSQSTKAPRTDGRLPYPELASRYLAKLPPGTRLYNDFGWGDFLIQSLHPQQTVFIDGRVDLYRDRIFDDYMRIDSLQAGWQALLTRYRINAVIIRNGSPLDGALAADEHWSAPYRDGLAVVYVTAVPAAGPVETVQRQPPTSASAPAA
ncbi:MAG: hypothetical protein Q8M37_02935 [Nevskia sp.]|nr:hypothetical protein [Nevskia sp.]